MEQYKFDLKAPKTFFRILGAIACTKYGFKVLDLFTKHVKLRLRISDSPYYVDILDASNFNSIMEIFTRGVYDIFPLREGWTIIDVGANIGDYVLYANYILKEKCKIVAIEAEPNNYNLMKVNIEKNNISNTLTLLMAIGDSQGYYRIKSEGVHSRIEVIERPEDEVGFALHNSSILPIESLDVVARSYDIKSIDLIKIDIEGAEFKLLQGAKELLEAKKIIRIIMETHSEQLHSNCENYLVSYGYKIVKSNFSNRYGTGILAAIDADSIGNKER